MKLLKEILVKLLVALGYEFKTDAAKNLILAIHDLKKNLRKNEYATIVLYGENYRRITGPGVQAYDIKGLRTAKSDNGQHLVMIGMQKNMRLNEETMKGKVVFLWPIDESDVCPITGLEPDEVLVFQGVQTVGVLIY